MMMRARFEASGKSEDEVTLSLGDAAMRFRDIEGGEWEDVEGMDCVPIILTTKEGFWGRLTIQRKGTGDSRPNNPIRRSR